MRFLVDESTGPAVARWLQKNGHNVYSVYEETPGTPDDEIIKKAFSDNRILITNDKDFGEKVFRERYDHVGVILLRLTNNRSSNKIFVLDKFLQKYSSQISNRFVVVNEEQVRFAKKR